MKDRKIILAEELHFEHAFTKEGPVEKLRNGELVTVHYADSFDPDEAVKWLMIELKRTKEEVTELKRILKVTKQL